MRRFLWEMMQNDIKAHKAVQFNFDKADLLGLAQILGVSFLQLRHQPQELSNEQVQEMIKRFIFFDSSRNKGGRGVSHAYVPYVHSNQKIVLDLTTDLTWQQSGSPDHLTFEQAQNYVKELNAKKHAGFNDWRLPTLEEAMSLMEPKKHGELYLDPIFDRKQWWIWTGDKESAGRAWCVYFRFGYCSHPDIGYDTYVRAVRS
jgi:hypothetical protein